MSCDVRYIDGRNHALDLVSAFVKKKRKKYSDKQMFKILEDREHPENKLYDFNPGYFSDYKD